MKRCGLVVASFLGLSYFNSAVSCIIQPAEQIVPYCQLVKRTKTIVLVRVSKAREINSQQQIFEYNLEVVESLKGKNIKDNLVLTGQTPVVGEKPDHEKKDPWLLEVRKAISGKCRERKS